MKMPKHNPKHKDKHQVHPKDQILPHLLNKLANDKLAHLRNNVHSRNDHNNQNVNQVQTAIMMMTMKEHQTQREVGS